MTETVTQGVWGSGTKLEGDGHETRGYDLLPVHHKAPRDAVPKIGRAASNFQSNMHEYMEV